jgi:hypothetical protein
LFRERSSLESRTLGGVAAGEQVGVPLEPADKGFARFGEGLAHRGCLEALAEGAGSGGQAFQDPLADGTLFEVLF